MDPIKLLRLGKEGNGHSLKTPETPLKFSRRKTVKCRFSSDVDTELKYIVLSFQTGRKYLGTSISSHVALGSINIGWKGYMKRYIIYLAVLSFTPSLFFHFFLPSSVIRLYSLSVSSLPFSPSHCNPPQIFTTWSMVLASITAYNPIATISLAL